MNNIIVHYKNSHGVVGSVPVELGETYFTAEEFVEEFLNDHPGYVIAEIEKEVS